VDLKGMETIIDALGGVDIDVKESEINILLADQKTKAFQKAGMQTLGGAQALVYMKDHTAEEKGSSHLSRVLAACVQKGIQLGFDPLIELVSELVSYVETNMTIMDMMDAALSALSAPVNGMETKQFPIDRREETIDNETFVHINDSAAESETLYAFLYGAEVLP
jgi:anionic cell wall polymer biosynthesis LytR-Cps2A-Psr (LCP) family protein